MTMQTVALSSLEPGRGNPRNTMDRNGLEGLAASIRNDGLLQNLVVRPVKGKGQHYRIVSGERRYRALKLLEERGEVDGDYAVPVEIRDSLTKDDSLRIATVENAAALSVLVVAEWLYLDWASRAPQPLPDNFVHAEWITLHNNPDFRGFVDFLRAELDRVGPADADLCSDFFGRAVALELSFFEASYADPT
jgi:thiaminase (transcriptional activator TenA)